MSFVCVRCRKEIKKGEVRFVDHDHICVSCLKPKKKKKHGGFIPSSGKTRDYFSRRRPEPTECELGCGVQVRSQEAHNSTKHFCQFCSKIFRHIDDHMKGLHYCQECDEEFEDLEDHQEEIHTNEEELEPQETS